MGVRLYPNTKEPAELCRLAGVPADTYEKLQAYEAKRPSQDGPAMDSWYQGLFARPALNALHSFELYGWGRLKPVACEYVFRVLDKDEAGSLTGSQAQELLSRQGIVAEGVTSVRWG